MAFQEVSMAFLELAMCVLYPEECEAGLKVRS